MENERVITYIDGFNLYFGIRENNWRKYYWLDLQKLSLNLLKPNQSLATTKYFTSRIFSSPDALKSKRQGDYLEALMTLSNFEIFYGQYNITPKKCSICGSISYIPQEKKTDVNISTQIIKDAYQDKFDMALLISGDSDLSGPIELVNELFPKKRVVIAFPPNRVSFDLKKLTKSWFVIDRIKFKKSQFPDKIIKSDGHVLDRPSDWA